MKPLFAFSKKKFLSLTPSARQNAVLKLLKELELNLPDREARERLLTESLKCLSWLDTPLNPELDAVSQSLKGEADIYSMSLALQNYFRVSGLPDHDYAIPLRTGDGAPKPDPKTVERSRQVIVILDNIRSAFNAGSIFRTAECLSLGGIWLCGITPKPGEHTFDKTAMGTAKKVAWRHFDATRDAVLAARASGFAVIALETAHEAESAFEADFPLPLALILGNESLGVDPRILELCDKLVHLPVLGWKNSLNVASAFTACAYQIIFGKSGSRI